MAVISKIQKFKWVAVGIILICILTFLFETISPNLNSLQQSSNYIGKVNGNSLDYDKFKVEFDQKEKEIKLQKGVNTIPEEDLINVKNQIWGKFLMDNVIGTNLEKLGINISPAEWVEVTTGQNVDPSLKQVPAFMNQMGQFDPMQFRNFLKSLKQDEPGTPQGTRMKSWLDFENQVKDQRKIGKFNAIIENSLYVPKWMSDFDTKFFATNVNIDYVALPYTTVDAKTVKYEPSELESYFKENKNKYTPVTPTVKVNAVTFSLLPSMADSIEIMTKFNEKMAKMQASTNDTSFFKAYGDKGHDLTFYKQSDLEKHPKLMDVFAAPARSIIGPYIHKDNVIATRVLARKNITDSVLVKAISISFSDVMQNQAGVNQRLKLVDSIFRMLDTLNMDFDQIAAKYSSDRGQNPPIWIRTQEKMWNYEVFMHGGSRKYFKSPSEREGVVRILKVINYPATIPSVMLGEISQAYAPSTETQNAVFNTAQTFVQKYKTAKDIEKLAKTNPGVQPKTVFVTKDNVTLDGIEGNGREAIRWAFDSKSGDISSMMQIGNNYVYLGNLGLRSKDNINFADVSEDVLPDFQAQKAFKLIGEKMNGSSLAEIAKKNGVTVISVDTMSFRNSNVGNMPEPGIVAIASSLKPNQLSKPIKGTGAVYRIMTRKVNATTPNPAEELQTKAQINQGFKTIQGLLEGMLNRYKIDDNRANMF